MVMNKLTHHVFKFERIRLENKTKTQHGERFGPYLYRDAVDGTLVASWNKPTKELNYLYNGEDIGYNTDALIYYKNT